MKNKTDDAWNSLFKKHDIIDNIEKNGVYQISATQIKEFREPRLMVKFDHTINLPKPFAEKGLSILPITRGDYIISHFNAYHNFEAVQGDITTVQLPYYIQSLDITNITSEAAALNCAYVSGIIADFLEDDQLVPTVSGRMSSGDFSFKIKDTYFNIQRSVFVNNSQMEIDAGYEGVQKLALIEAKLDLSDDFIVRQIYYPFRVWSNRVSKSVKPIFLVYSNGIFYLYEYKFQNYKDYNSLELVKQKRYTVEEDRVINRKEIVNLLSKVQTIREPKIAFPQADNFDRIINLCELLKEHPMTKYEITIKYAFDARQADYYTSAARYLGLVEKKKDNKDVIFSLTPKGESILCLKYKSRHMDFCRAILSHEVFAKSLEMRLKNNNITKQDILKIMKNCDLYNLESEATYNRRASTVKSWIEWIINLINES